MLILEMIMELISEVQQPQFRLSSVACTLAVLCLCESFGFYFIFIYLNKFEHSCVFSVEMKYSCTINMKFKPKWANAPFTQKNPAFSPLSQTN